MFPTATELGILALGKTSILLALPQVSVNVFSRAKSNGKSAKEAAAGDLGCRITSPHVPSRSL